MKMRPLLSALFVVGCLPAPAQDTPAGSPESTSGFGSYAKTLIIVEGDRGRGSGSVIKFHGNPLIVTNAHVLSGNSRVTFRTLRNQTLLPGKLGLATNADLAVFTQAETTDGLEILERVDEQASIGDEIIVLGNSLGGAVATEIRGKLLGIGPELIEVDAKFVQGNSGSPIIHLKSGKVIGIATFATWEEADPLISDSRFKDVRRFGLRIDTAIQWEYPTWEKFSSEARQIEASMRAVSTLMMLDRDIGDDGRLEPSTYAQVDERFQRRVRDFVTEMNRPRMAAGFYQSTKREFLRWVENETACPPSAFKLTGCTEYHRNSLRKMQFVRGKLKTFFSMLGAVQTGNVEFDSLTTAALRR